MNATLLAKTAYANADQSLRTARDSEYEIFARLTRRLIRSCDDAKDFAGLARAIHDNRQLWAQLAADVALPDNTLPRELRGRIAWLAEFTRKHSRKVLRGEASATILIEINTAVMRGLRSEGTLR